MPGGPCKQRPERQEPNPLQCPAHDSPRTAAACHTRPHTGPGAPTAAWPRSTALPTLQWEHAGQGRATQGKAGRGVGTVGTRVHGPGQLGRCGGMGGAPFPNPPKPISPIPPSPWSSKSTASRASSPAALQGERSGRGGCWRTAPCMAQHLPPSPASLSPSHNLATHLRHSRKAFAHSPHRPRRVSQSFTGSLNRGKQVRAVQLSQR